ncbi:MAG: sugar phosphate isomerase/epimerase [Candidatus Omnitrophica bacterium]|nr:sugar phosphate isomerase/epimerase [Candidatus Omnitrophota bacterium]MBU1047569.1 sugar phosphate isomerase/epimerase [Candidatus Omnitrophota bacterium]MBU1630487.1 sugar phosphate isomerase/epimerase [Candidatus Omnitrophota bacterium]MBU1767000.1 sugar phosphate isomerase/epimerase [Candidatus Omnitrophota bacterium]MBU1888932.1 sugar phosphate isomerase/epimerase [Candidatus Omnitrophota bacterium]
MELGLVIPELEECYQKGTFYKTIEILQKAEIHKIEAHASFLLNKTHQKLFQLNQDLEKRNITISSIHAPFGEDKDLSIPSSIIRKRTINQHIAVMKQMDIIKTRVLTIHPGGRIKKDTDISSREKLFKKSLEILLKNAEHLNIKLAVENMLPMRPGYRVETLKQLLDEFPSPFLGICFDTGHANVGKGVLETFNVIKKKMFDCHVHDNDGTKDMHLQPPYGKINWAEFFTAVENIDFKRPLMIESLPWQGRELSWMFKEVRMLKDNQILEKDSPKKHFLRCRKCNHFIYNVESEPICYCNFCIQTAQV